MSVESCRPTAGQTARVCLRPVCRTSVLTVCCLMAHIPAAHAHEDSAPPTPANTLLGVLLFVVVTAWVLYISFKARLPERRRIAWLRQKRKLRRRKS